MGMSVLWSPLRSSWPATPPSSASTVTPWAASMAERVSATFISKGSSEPSIMTDVNPAATQRATVSTSGLWSRCTATGTLASRAAARTASTSGVNPA